MKIKVYLFVWITALTLPHFTTAQTTHIRIETPQSQQTLTLDYFAPIGGEFQNYYFPSPFKKEESQHVYTASFALKKPAFLQVKGPMGVHNLYVEPGDTVQAKLLNQNGKPTLTFQGTHHEANQVFNDWMRQTDFKQIHADLDERIQDPQEFNSFATRAIKRYQAPFLKLKEENKLSQAALELFDMQIFAKYFARFRIMNLAASGAPSIGILDPLKHIIFPDSLVEDVRWIHLSEGRAYLVSFNTFNKKLEKTSSQNGRLQEFGSYSSYAQANPHQQQHMLANAMFVQTQLNMKEFDYDKALESYKKLFPESPFIPLLMENSPSRIEQPTRNVMESKVSRNSTVQATAKVIHYQAGELNVEPFVLLPDLQSLIKQYGAGKTLLLDFWATWCVPCIQEFQHSKALKSFFEAEDVIPIYISTDKPDAVNKWERMLVQYGLEGIHVFAGPQLNEHLKEEYQLHTIPRYMIVSPSGEIVELNAPRPSNREELKQLILKTKK